MTNTNIKELIDALGWRNIESAPENKLCWFYTATHHEFVDPNAHHTPTKTHLCKKGGWPATQYGIYWLPYNIPPPPGQPTEAQQIITKLVEIAEGRKEVLETCRSMIRHANIPNRDVLMGFIDGILKTDILEAFTQDKTSEVE